MKRYIALFLSVVLVAFCLNVNANAISAASYILYSPDTNEIISEYNSGEKLPMASTTKIMTAYLTSLYVKKFGDKLVNVTKEMCYVEGSALGLKVGDKINLSSLIAGMLLASGNDAANTAAVFIGGSLEKFVIEMNEKAKEFGLNSTSFETPSGLDGEKHFSTAKDMARLCEFVLQDDIIKNTVSKEYIKITYYSSEKGAEVTLNLKNHNKLLSKLEGCIGVKTGFTKKAGRCLVSACEREGRTLICVTLNAPDDWNDHLALYSKAFGKALEYTPGINKIKAYTACGQQVTLQVIQNKAIKYFTENEIKEIIYLPRFIYKENLPECGRVDYVLNGKIIGTNIIGLTER